VSLTIFPFFEFQTLLGCSDARVPANEIMGEECGSVFVVRNVANLVVSTDFNLMGALQYAVNVLKVPHIIVCGHYDCGGVRASMERKDKDPPLENWLRNIRDVYVGV
jgi:carbonic anhydrase